MNERFRRIESNAEKIGGSIITALGIISLNLPEVALGLALVFIGKWRTPKVYSH
jgi:hypothetical protein